MLTDEFRRARSPRIELNGRTVLLFDTLSVPYRCRLLLRFLAVDSEWRQGVRLGDLSAKTGLRLTVLGQTAPGLQLWQDTSPAEVTIDLEAPGETLTLYNIWDPGNGQAQSQVLGAGMGLTVSEDGRQRVYRCNDGHAESTFTHLVFSLEILDD
jgi:hypothetical protein